MLRYLFAFLVVVTVAASPARADKATWQGIFVGSTAIALAGGALMWHGLNQLDHAEEQLCRGTYASSCEYPPSTLQVEHANVLGDHGSKLATVGGAMVIVGAAVSAVAAYKGFIAKDRERQPTVAVAPVLLHEGAGASLQLRF